MIGRYYEMTAEEFEDFAQALLDQFTADELFDFMDEQGAFDSLKIDKVVELNEISTSCLDEKLNND